TENDWKAKFHGAFLYLKNKNDQAAIDSVVHILKHTPEYKKGYFRIWNRETLNQKGVNPNVALALAMDAGIRVRSGTGGKIVKVYKGTARSGHGWDPAYPSMHTTFIAVGAGIGKHKNIKGMGIVDIAPVIAKLLGLDFNAPDGKLVQGILAN